MTHLDSKTVELEKDKELIIVISKGVYDPNEHGETYYAHPSKLTVGELAFLKKSAAHFIENEKDLDRIYSIFKKMEHIDVHKTLLKEGYWSRTIYHVELNDRPNPSWD